MQNKKLTRRDVLGLAGTLGAGIAVAAIVGCNDDEDSGIDESTAAATGTAGATTAAASTTAATTATATPEPVACVVTPAMTEGPYFVDERLNRSDITSDPTTGVVSDGVPLTLTLTVSSVDGASACTPITGAVVDMWHCDALGEYSDISAGAGQSDTRGLKFLRGYQTTDANGRVTFQTIYPGWYSGRSTHIHYKVRQDPDSNSGLEFTSQLFFDEDLTSQIYSSESPYTQKGQKDVSNASDNIYDPDTLLTLTQSGDGYSGSFHVGVSIT